MAVVLIALLVGFPGTAYLWNFRADAGNDNTRIRLARDLAQWRVTRDEGMPAVVVTAEPAPYCCPPMRFGAIDLFLIPSASKAAMRERDAVLIRPVDGSKWKTPNEPAMFRVWPKANGPHSGPYDSDWPGPTPISWANKPFEVIRRGTATQSEN